MERGMESMGDLSEQFRRRGYDEAKQEYEGRIVEMKGEYEGRIVEMKGEYEGRIVLAVIALMDAGMSLDEALDRVCTAEDRGRISEGVSKARGQRS